MFSPIVTPITGTIFSKSGFTVTQLLEDGFNDKNESYVGMEFKMKRALSTFLFQYYLPSAAIVFVSQISFIVPTASIPGRLGLLATLFLTLTNLFINHMVRFAKN